MTHFEAGTKWELLDGDSVRWGGGERRGEEERLVGECEMEMRKKKETKRKKEKEGK